mmetsp:Transcript_54336/g.119166  ORF Transcript_54336/g.119166 Transcript_54336/m.119166 type:complete len:321 (+) Transcript_54336:53-1015(+)
MQQRPGIQSGRGRGDLVLPYRDHTQSFLKRRVSHRQKKRAPTATRSYTGKQSEGSESLLYNAHEHSDVDGVDIELQALPIADKPTSLFDFVEQLKSDLKTIADLIPQLAKLQRNRLKRVFDESGEGEINSVSGQLDALFRQCEQNVKRLQAFDVPVTGLSKNDATVRLNVQRTLATRLQSLSGLYRQQQKHFMGELKKRSAAGEVQSSCSDTGFNDSQMHEMEVMETSAEDRAAEIQRIAKSITDLHSLFKEMSVLVIDQGSLLDRVDYNIEHCVDQVAMANQQLKKAEQASSSRRGNCCIALLLLGIFLNLLVLVVRWA